MLPKSQLFCTNQIFGKLLTVLLFLMLPFLEAVVRKYFSKYSETSEWRTPTSFKKFVRY